MPVLIGLRIETNIYRFVVPYGHNEWLKLAVEIGLCHRRHCEPQSPQDCAGRYVRHTISANFMRPLEVEAHAEAAIIEPIELDFLSNHSMRNFKVTRMTANYDVEISCRLNRWQFQMAVHSTEWR